MNNKNITSYYTIYRLSKRKREGERERERDKEKKLRKHGLDAMRQGIEDHRSEARKQAGELLTLCE